MNNKLKEISEKISNYDSSITKLHNTPMEGIEEKISILLFNNDIKIDERYSYNDNVINRMSWLVRISYNGWFDSLKPLKKLYNFIDLNGKNAQDFSMKSYTLFGNIVPKIQNDYQKEYSACYRGGNFNVFEYLQLIIKVLEHEVDNINRFLQKVYNENELLEERDKTLILTHTIADLNEFIRVINLLQKFRIALVNENIEKLDLDNEVAELIKSVTENIITIEDKQLLYNVLDKEVVDQLAKKIFSYELLQDNNILNKIKIMCKQ